MATNPSEVNIRSVIRLNKNPTNFANYSKLNGRLEQSRYCEMEKSDKVSDDVHNLLPCDPFGMDISPTLTKCSGLLETISDDLASPLPCDPFGMNLGTFEDLTCSSTSDDLGTSDVAKGEDRLPEDANFVCDDDSFNFLSQINDLMAQHECFLAGLREGDPDDVLDDIDTYANVVEGCPPHEGLLFALNYLGVKELLSVERVCKSLRDAVQSDPLLWKRICIYHPLNTSIDDNALIKLTDRAQGALECLVLVECRRITDFGLGHVLQRNTRISKLSVPKCSKLSIEGILLNLKTLKSMGKLNLKVLRISEIAGVKKEQFEQLISLLDNPIQPLVRKPQFYGFGTLHLSCDDNRFIDIEKCPSCDRYRQVYDCTLENCSNSTNPSCRGCTICIARCIYCGRCIRGLNYVETFHFDLACVPCFRKMNRTKLIPRIT